MRIIYEIKIKDIRSKICMFSILVGFFLTTKRLEGYNLLD